MENKIITLTINSILGGHSSLKYLTAENQYLDSIAIDPDFPISETDKKPSGMLRPVAYEKFSGANVDGNPIAIITNPKDTKVYAVLDNGDIISYTSALGSETLVGTVAGANAEGACYYNNYIYIFGTGADKDDVSRYGPLDGSPSLADNVWKGATLGSQTALGDTAYPSIRGSGNLPNHWGFAHQDNRLYFCDYKDGTGYIHFIKTKKTTDEGDTNDGSTYNALDLPFGFMPVCITNWGTDLVIGAIQTSNSTLSQGKAALFFWDCSSSSFYRIVYLPEPVVSALLNNNGIVYIWAGRFSTDGGYSVRKYIGGDTISRDEDSLIFGEGHPPLQGAVDGLGSRIVWGSWITTPEPAACVWRCDSSLLFAHNIARATASASSSDGVITALKFAEQGSSALPKMLLGWRDGTPAYGIDKLSTTYQTHYFRKMFNIGRNFSIKKIKLSLAKAVAANMAITPKILVDDESSSKTLTTINNTNYPNKRKIKQYPDVQGENNFIFELKWSGTALLPVLLPIDIDVEIY